VVENDCVHVWVEVGDFDLGGGRTEVECRICGVPGERNDLTGEVVWPTT
jgi:hypothetical protein